MNIQTTAARSRRLEQTLRRGTSIGGGEFVLDQAQAREKLREFQLVNPNHYVLEFIKVAHLLGASAIDIKIDADELEMSFDGERFLPEQFERLHSAPFSQRVDASEQALRHLAIGVNAAQGIGLGELRIEVGGGEDGGVAFQLANDEVERVAVKGAVLRGTRVYLRERTRPGHILRFVESMRRRLPKAQILKEYCGFARVPITVNGEMISGQVVLPGKVNTPLEFQGEEYCKLGITLKNKLVKVHVVHHGVLVGEHQRMGAYMGAHAVIDSPRLTLNLSQSAFVEDAAWGAIEKLIKGLMLAALQKYLRELAAEEVLAGRDEIVGVVLPILRDLTRRDHGAHRRYALPGIQAIVDDRFMNTVATLPIFASATGVDPAEHGRFWSIASARSQEPESEATRLRYSTQPFDFGIPHLDARPTLVVPSEFQDLGQVVFGHFADVCHDITDLLRQAHVWLQNHRLWMERPWPERPAVDETSGIQFAERVGELGVCVTWSANPRAGTGMMKVPGVEVCYVKGGRLLARKVATDLGLDGLSIYVSGELDTNDMFSAPTDATLETAWKVAKPLVERMCSELPLSQRLEAMLAIVERRFHEGLNALAGIPVWPTAQHPMDALGALADDACFAELRGHTWSLRALAAALKDGVHQQIFVVVPQYRGLDALARDQRLADDLVLVLNAPGMRIIWRLFGAYTEQLADLVASGFVRKDHETAAARNQRQWMQQPLIDDADWPAGEMYLPLPVEAFARRTCVVNGLTVIVAWRRMEHNRDWSLSSWLYYRKDGRLLTSYSLSGFCGMHLSIGGDMEVKAAFDGPVDTPALAQAKLSLVEICGEVVEEILQSLGQAALRKTLVRMLSDLISGRCKRELMRALEWKSWPTSLPSSLITIDVDEIASVEPQARAAALGLECLMELRLFEDISGRLWSLEELMHRPLILTTEHRIWARRADKRLQGQVALYSFAGFYRVDVDLILRAVFGARIKIMSVEGYLADGARDASEAMAALLRPPDSPPAPPPDSPPAPPPDSPPALSPVSQPGPRPTLHSLRLLEAVQTQLASVDGSYPALSAFDISTHWVACDDELAGATRSPLSNHHPAIEHALAYPEDPVALAFVSVALYDMLSADHAESSATVDPASGSREELAFLAGLSAVLEAHLLGT